MTDPRLQQAYRASVEACRACGDTPAIRSTPWLPGPRYGTGCVKAPDLMVLGTNPPADPARRLHGAWMLHYSESYERGPSERLVKTLLTEVLGVPLNRVWASQAYKCATAHNADPCVYALHRCATLHLDAEVAAVQPRVMLIFGTCAFRGWISLESTRIGFYSLLHVAARGGGSGVVRYHAAPYRLVHAPHPSYARRFLDTDDWCSKIKQAYLTVTA